MNNIEPADKIIPRILSRYSDSPRGWRVISTPRGEMLVVGPDSVFQLQLIPLNPYEVTGAGVELRESNDTIELLRTSPEYGLRPLDKNDLQNLLQSMSNPASSRMNLNSIIMRDPIHPQDLVKTDVEHILTGPVLTRPELGSMSSDIGKIQRSLERKAQEIFQRKFPERTGMYL